MSISACLSCGTKNRLPVSATGRPQCAKCHAALPWLVDAGDDNLQSALEANQLVLVDLWAPWCGPCRMVAPVLERLAARFAGRIKVVKVNVDNNPATAARFEAQSIPTLVFLRDHEVVGKFVGAQPERVLAERIEALLPSTRT